MTILGWHKDRRRGLRLKNGRYKCNKALNWGIQNLPKTSRTPTLILKSQLLSNWESFHSIFKVYFYWLYGKNYQRNLLRHPSASLSPRQQGYFWWQPSFSEIYVSFAFSFKFKKKTDLAHNNWFYSFLPRLFKIVFYCLNRRRAVLIEDEHYYIISHNRIWTTNFGYWMRVLPHNIDISR